MAYVKNTWVDQDVERPKTYEVTNNQDGSITLTDSFGLVAELGTPVNAANMNHIEDGLALSDVMKYSSSVTYSQGEWVTGIVDNEKKIFASLANNNTGNALTDETKWKEVQLGGSSRNIGEIVTSTIPLTDAGLHLLDGSKLQYGSYKAFIDYIADLYDNTTTKYSNVIKYGSLADSDGVLSGFSSSSYAVIPNANIGTADTWEQVWKVTTPNDVSSSHFINSGLNAICHDFGYVDGIWKMFLSSNGTSWDIVNGATNNISVSTNTTYLVKLEFTGTAYNMLVSTDDGNTWTTVATYSSSTKVYSVNSFKIGNTNDSLWVWSGTIDLNGSYININGFRWWSGMNVTGFCSEVDWQTSVSTYGVCGKFVYDDVNNTVRLPKITGILEGTTDVTALGDLVEAGLPNITGTYIGVELSDNPQSYSGALYPISGGTSPGSGTGGSWGIAFDASRSSSTYGNSSTVQPQAIKVLYYIVIATTTKTDIEVDIDEITTDLNSKADVDLTNLNNTGKIAIAHNAMPSPTTFIRPTLGASGASYIAPADGFVFATSVSTAVGQYIYLANSNVATTNWSGGGSELMQIYLPVSKGDTYILAWTSATPTEFKFVYAVGSESEAS